MAPWGAKIKNTISDRLSILFTNLGVAARTELEARMAVLLPQRDPEQRRGAGRRPCMDYKDLLGLGLHHLCSSSSSVDCQLLFGVIPSTYYASLELALSTLHAILTDPGFHDARVAWPTLPEMEQYALAIAADGGGDLPEGLDGVVFGFVDGICTQIPCPTDAADQPQFWSGIKHMYCVNNLLVFGPDGTILWYSINNPVSAHDLFLCSSLMSECLDDRAQTPEEYGLIGDVGFYCADLKHRIFTVPKQTAAEERRGAESTCEARGVKAARDRWIYWKRQAVEWGMRSLRTAFYRLRTPLSADPAKRKRLLDIMMHLHNYRVRSGHKNQIGSVYRRVLESRGREQRHADEMNFGHADIDEETLVGHLGPDRDDEADQVFVENRWMPTAEIRTMMDYGLLDDSDLAYSQSVATRDSRRRAGRGGGCGRNCSPACAAVGRTSCCAARWRRERVAVGGCQCVRRR
jgi:hypothetical protein